VNEIGSSRDELGRHSITILGNHSITISGTAAEMDLIRSMMTGAKWIGTEGGKLWGADRLKPLPSPVDDPMLPPKWSIKVPVLDQGTKKEIEKAMGASARDSVKTSINVRDDVEPDEGWHYPGFIVQHLCGYNWSKANYRDQAQRLTNWGFECCRSRRGADGRFREVWYLPFASMATGRLKEVVDQVGSGGGEWQELCKVIVKFLCENASFGTLDVTVQRAAMVIE